MGPTSDLLKSKGIKRNPFRPAQARDAKQRAYTRVYTRAIRGDYVVVPPHNKRRSERPFKASQSSNDKYSFVKEYLSPLG